MSLVRKQVAILPALVLLLVAGRAARGEVIDISARTTASVVQLDHGTSIQSDSNEQEFPGTTTVLPVISRAKLDRLDSEGATVASAECVSLFNDPRVTRAVPPNDVGLDIGAFSDDDRTGYNVNGSVMERRTVRFTSAELQRPDGQTARVRSVLYLAGAFLVIGEDAAADLTGLEIEILVRIQQQRPGAEPVELLYGRATLTGGPNGATNVTGAGVINPSLVPIMDILPLISDPEDITLARLVPFTLLAFGYEYEAVVGETFELALSFDVRVDLPPVDLGAAAIFGLPQQALGDAMARVQKDALGRRVERAVSTVVDTTGTGGPAAGPLFGLLGSLCGALGLESALLPAVMLGVVPLGRFGGRARRARPDRRGREWSWAWRSSHRRR